MKEYIKIPVTDRMRTDLSECEKMAEDGKDKDCESCSLNGGKFGCMGDRKWVKELLEA